MEETTKTAEEIRKENEEKAIAKEMLPFFVYMAIPVVITIIIALVFAPNMTLP